MSTDRAQGSSARGWFVPGIALAAAGVLVVYTVMSGPAPSATAPPNAPTSPTNGLDEHEVQTASGVFSFGLVGSDLVVSRVGTSGTTELGRPSVPALASGGQGQPPILGGSGVFAMVCPSSGGDQRFVFGWVTTPGAAYSGPTATGHIASDGSFLYVLAPGGVSAPVAIGLPDAARALVGLNASIFDDAKTSGTKQPSGCLVIG